MMTCMTILNRFDRFLKKKHNKINLCKYINLRYFHLINNNCKYRKCLLIIPVKINLYILQKSF